MKAIPTEFTRTKCACDSCRACCKRQPGSLADGDLDRIVQYWSKAQGVSAEVALEQIKAQLCASPGALIMDSTSLVTKRVGTIVPKMRKGRCVFLDKDERCIIHEVAPFGCAYFDCHMSRVVAHPRSVWLVHTQMDRQYQALRNELPYAQNYKPTRY